MKRTSFRHLLWTGMLGLAACGGSGGPQDSEDLRTSGVAVVEIRPAIVGDLDQRIATSGIVAGGADGDLHISAPQAGRVAAIPHGIGESVRRGDLLVRFDIPTLEQELAARRGELAQAESRLSQARESATRLGALLARGIAARKDEVAAERELVDATAARTAAEAGERSALELDRQREVRAPFAGIVVSRWKNVGDRVDPGDSDPVLRLVDPAALEVIATVPAAELQRDFAGRSATIAAPGAPEGIAGAVKSAPGLVDPATGSAAVRISLASGSHLIPGMSVGVEILTGRHRNVVIVPQSAIVTEGPEFSVFVVDARRIAHRIPVELGITNGPMREIVHGVAAGDRIVVRGQAGLPDGATVAEAP
ncbi:MAG: efflux RND transporter periplasmic adaptor subunit [Thermoanaerobaculia bacterium]